MRKGFLTLFLAYAGAFCLHAQCEGCTLVVGESIDFCYQDPALTKRCVQFIQDSNTFYFQDDNRKKARTMKMALPASLGAPTSSYLQRLDPDKKLKLSSEDLQLIGQGIETWRQLEAIRLWDTTIVNRDYVVTKSGLAYKPIMIGHGKLPEIGKKVNIHYTGYLESGKQFESSLDGKRTFQFTLGLGQVIKGWDEGLAIMTVGSRYLLRIPPALGYGQAGAGGDIPPNATLIFDVQLVSAE